MSIPSLGPQQQDLVPNGISVSSEPQDSEPCESEFEATLSLSASDHDQARGIHNLSCGLEQLPVEESHPPEVRNISGARHEQYVTTTHCSSAS